MAFIHEMRSLQASIDPPDMPLFPGTASGNNDNSNGNNLHPKSHSSNATDMLMLSMAKQNFSTILNAVHKMEEYWAGVNYVATLLEKRKSMATDSRPYTDQHGADGWMLIQDLVSQDLAPKPLPRRSSLSQTRDF